MKRSLSAFSLLIYVTILLKIMVFKDVPAVKVGQMILNFGGVQADRPANVIPFKTIFPYLLGDKGLLIAGINLVGNIVLLIPLGFLLPLIYKQNTWKQSLFLAVLSGLVIEVLQVLLRVGIFDIDDVILNALGVMIGYWTFFMLTKWILEKKYKTITVSVLLIITTAIATLYAMYPHGQSVSPRVTNGVNQSKMNNENEISPSHDLCGGTGGNGEIVRVENNRFTLKHKDGRNQIITLADNAAITTSVGNVSLSDLKPGYHVTLVGGPNSDGSFTAEAVFVCNGAGPTK